MLVPWRWPWLRRRLPAFAHLEVTLYTRPGCHLCEIAWKFLRRERRRYGFRCTIVNVDSDAELVEQYGDLVPVVAVNGKVRFRGGINPVLWRRLLQHSR